MGKPLQYFAALRDPRIERNLEHLLEEILQIAIAAELKAGTILPIAARTSGSG